MKRPPRHDSARWRQHLQIAIASVLVAISVLLIPGAQANEQTLHADIELISAYKNLKPNSVQDFALVVKPAPGWYTYWRNPGEVGKPTAVKWSLPMGLNAGEPEWPVPVRKVEDGGISYAFPDAHVLPVAIAVGEQLDFTRSDYELIADVSWLDCKDICIPERTTVSLTLPLANASDDEQTRRSTHYEQIQRAKTLIPPLNRDIPASFSAQQQGDKKILRIQIPQQELPPFVRQPGALVGIQGIVNEQVEASISATETSVTVQFEQDSYLESLPENFSLILTGLDPESSKSGAIELHVEAGSPALALATAANSNDAANTPAGNPTEALSIGTAILFAFLGGLILNAMPCVFPVLSLKVIGLVQSNTGGDARELRRHRHQHGIAYTAGVVVSFLAIAVTLIVLRSLGEQIGWGFQLQSPVFIAILAIIIFVLGLSMSGVIEIGSSLQNIGNGSVTEKQGHWQGAFWTGVLATVVATPCTAPFMGTAMGFALSQPIPLTLTVFIAMALGLASPFLAIAFIPVLARLMPRPGMWMVRLKELLAFPLYLTAVWLVWVFARQAGTDAAALLLVALVCVAMACWAWRISFTAQSKRLWTSLSAIMLLATVYSLYNASTVMAAAPAVITAATKAAAHTQQNSVAYSPATLEAALERGDTVLVNMTADWCITCKVNEKVALRDAEVQTHFAADNVTYIKGDWTNSDPEITSYLDSFGRNGVPLYVVYQPGAAPKVLPQILTPTIVKQALRQ